MRKIVHNTDASRYECDLGGDIAVIDYIEMGDGVVAFVHTGVPAQYEGQGIASELTRAALQDCRERGVKVRPACSFAAGYVRRHPEWEDLLG